MRFESAAIKEARTLYPVHPLIKNRFSARSFSDTPISRDTLLRLIEAASWAPSSMNAQPWRYVAAFKGEALFETMKECLLPANRVWAENASVLILSSAITTFSNGMPNRHALYDVGAANANLFTEATSLDIYGHTIGGFDYDKTLKLFNQIPPLEPVAFIALGYLGSPEQLSEPFKQRELTRRERLPLESLVKFITE
jgi:nitroreductase